jgi:AraC family transcriptional regulator of adaptative response/methylated-DNA-[protein]-cysteine methyltransferase
MAKITDMAPCPAELLRYDIYESSLGLALIAVSACGVCAIMFGDDRATLQKELQRRFRAATIAPPDRTSRALSADILALIESRKDTTPPLDMRGTDFQKRVWRALLEVPAGSTISYKELAERTGTPLAVRAVAGACAANPLALVVPCHRVVRHDGGLSGYRWGVARKQALLRREGVLAGGAKRVGPRLAPRPG